MRQRRRLHGERDSACVQFRDEFVLDAEDGVCVTTGSCRAIGEGTCLLCAYGMFADVESGACVTSGSCKVTGIKSITLPLRDQTAIFHFRDLWF